MLRLPVPEERLEERVAQDAVVEELLEAVQRGLAAGVLVEGRALGACSCRTWPQTPAAAPPSNSFGGADDNQRLCHRWGRGSRSRAGPGVRGGRSTTGTSGGRPQALNLTQQALSKRVARLEAGLGRLLERDRGGVALTPGGRALPARRATDARGRRPRRRPTSGRPRRPRCASTSGASCTRRRGSSATPRASSRTRRRAQHAPRPRPRARRARTPRARPRVRQRRRTSTARCRRGRAPASSRPTRSPCSSTSAASSRSASTSPRRTSSGAASGGRRRAAAPRCARSPRSTPRSIGASLRTDGSNLGLDALLERVASDPGPRRPRRRDAAAGARRRARRPAAPDPALPVARGLAHRRPAPRARRPPRVRSRPRAVTPRRRRGDVAAERGAGGLSVAQLTIRALVMCG